ncbi:unnamed protein product, partial [Durusdinium trenchii]
EAKKFRNAYRGAPREAEVLRPGICSKSLQELHRHVMTRVLARLPSFEEEEVPASWLASGRELRLSGRWLETQSASYTFPKPDTKMNAKIDVYQHVGSGSVVIDPKFFTTDEVSIRCHDVLMQNIRLQVTSQVAQASAEEGAGVVEEQCQRRQAAQEENKESALTYLTVHGIEQTR